MIHLALLVASALFLLWVAFIVLAILIGVVGKCCKPSQRSIARTRKHRTKTRTRVEAKRNWVATAMFLLWAGVIGFAMLVGSLAAIFGKKTPPTLNELYRRGMLEVAAYRQKVWSYSQS